MSAKRNDQDKPARSRTWMLGIPAAALLVLAGTGVALTSSGPEHPAVTETVTVYKSPTCGCCTAWVDHLREEGFTVQVHEMPDVTPMRREAGVPDHLASCHTSVVGGYAVEGHVPAEAIRRLMAERPAVAGISAPGMPQGAPGMGEGGGFDVVSFTRDGAAELFERY